MHGLGYDISIPWGDNARYDFVLDVNHKLYKLQCKTSTKESDGVYNFRCNSSYLNAQGNRTREYSNDDVDFFCTFIENKCYLVPYDQCGKREKKMRFVKPKNNQTQGITFAQEYLAEKVLANLN